MQIPYVKMNGAGNDYIYVDNLAAQFPFTETNLSELSKRLSDRTRGIGSDGLIVLEKPTDASAKVFMRMFNADGSEGKMCGNGIRCVTKLAYEKFGPQSSYKIQTQSGLKECTVVDASEKFIVRVNMGRPSFLPAKIPVLFDDVMVMDEEFEVLDRNFHISCVGMGNPHCVIEVENLSDFDVAKYGSVIEKHEAFPEGVNVEFVELRSDGLHQRTWERGSGETKACGTGACAAAVSYILRKKLKSPVDVYLKGGTLRIEWDGLREVYMTGDAVTETRGTFEL